jgi:hypothetical protein
LYVSTGAYLWRDCGWRNGDTPGLPVTTQNAENIAMWLSKGTLPEEKRAMCRSGCDARVAGEKGRSVVRPYERHILNMLRVGYFSLK